jgi:hypothetical protein
MSNQIRDSRVRWELVWILCAAIIDLAANLYTGEPLLSLPLAHIVIALIVAALLTALIFGVVETFVFLRGVFRSLTTSPR